MCIVVGFCSGERAVVKEEVSVEDVLGDGKASAPLKVFQSVDAYVPRVNTLGLRVSPKVRLLYSGKPIPETFCGLG